MELLKLADERGVRGVAKVVAYRRITTIADLRKGLEFLDRHRFRDESAASGDLSPTTSGNASAIKRKSSSNHSSETASEPKRRRSESQKSKLGWESKSVDKARLSLYKFGEDLWENRIYSCLVISPAGRVISEFDTVKQLLESMRDAIRAHQSLYVTGRILHRDISSNNIIITDPKTADGFKGMLIDFDLAKVRDSGPSGARHQTGTMQFMAVEDLRKADHTYRHDLESFFYVLLWMCARQSWTKKHLCQDELPPNQTRLRKWEIGSFDDIADSKEGHMTVNSLERIIHEFPASFEPVKPLCLRIRSILFGDTARLVLGTPLGDEDQLYGPIIEVYDEVISDVAD